MSLFRAATALIAAGCVVSFPIGDGARYDIVAEIPGKGFWRVQVKTGRIKSGAVTFPGYSVGYRDNLSLTYEDDVDMFAVACPENHKVYLIPIAEVRPARSHLRLDATLNRQTRRIRWAVEYEVGIALPVWLSTATPIAHPPLTG